MANNHEIPESILGLVQILDKEKQLTNVIMKTEQLNIIETLFTIKFDKELQAILKKDLAAYKQRAAIQRKTIKQSNIPAAA